MRPGEGKVHWPSSPIRNVGAADMLDEESFRLYIVSHSRILVSRS